MAARRGSYENLLSWKACSHSSNRGHVVAVSTNNDRPVKHIVEGVFQKCHREMNVSFLFFVPLPSGSAGTTRCILLAEASHVALYADASEGGYVLAVTSIRSRHPRREG